MNVVAIGEFRKLGAERIKALLPIIVTADGAPAFLIGDPSNVICLTDLHPRVQHTLLAQEKKARGGMPPPVRVYYDEILKGKDQLEDG